MKIYQGKEKMEVVVVVIIERVHRRIGQQETGNFREISEADSKNKNVLLH
jgi:hypothetical protein